MQKLIEIHIISYNEEIMLPFTLTHYKRMFTDPVIVVHDNFSSDRTQDIAREFGCEVVPFSTEGMNDVIQSMVKSDAAKNATAKWVLCIDSDELCYINEQDLQDLEDRGITAVRFEGWNIFDEVSSPWEIVNPRGRQEDGYSKPVLLRTGIFEGIQFAAGAHDVMLYPEPIWATKEFKLLHYKHWSCQYNLKRSAELAGRQSDSNKQHNHSYHFGLPADAHINYFNQALEQSVTIQDKHIQNAE